MKKTILFIVPYPQNTAPSQRLKFEQYYAGFEQHGYQVTTASFINERFWEIVYKKGFYLKKAIFTIGSYLRRYQLLSTAGNYDVVYVHLWGTPFGLPIYEWLLRRCSKKLIYDIDDLIYQGSSSPVNKLVKYIKSSSKVDFLMKRADHVLVSTDKLLDYTSQFTSNVSLVPATIDVKKYNLTKNGAPDKVVIGWSGSHTTSKYLHLLDDVLKKLSARPDVRIMVMGDKTFAINNLDIELVNWTAENEIQNLNQFDIGLHPVPDEEWVYGKSGGKLVQYMATGIPIVASAIGPNFKAIEDGYNGFLVSSDDEWLNKLLLLITDHSLRKQMGANAKTFAVERYSVEANIDKYLAIFN
ncbi:glycosyltransferase [Mucilaginibacter sp. AW1-3]